MARPTPTTPKPTLVLLVRHGQTSTTGSILPGRAPGLHLAEKGEQQAEAVAARIAEGQGHRRGLLLPSRTDP